MESAPPVLLDALWRLAQGARWYSGRSRGGRAGSVRLGDWVAAPVPGPGIRNAVLEVGYPGGGTEEYLVPLVFRPVGQEVAPELCRLEVDGTVHSVAELLDDARASAQLLPALASGLGGFRPAREIPSGLSARRYAGEQSNTTIFFGDQVLGKVFRRLEPGRNPDAELHEALADTGAVAALYGTWRAGEVDLAIFLEALPDPADGYVLACEHAAAAQSFATLAHDLGSALATVHDALARRLPTSRASLTDVAAGCRRRFEEAAAEISELQHYRDAVTAAFAALGEGDVTTSRIHGDCHLGQVLRTEGRWVYVDFEGEPLKTIAERRLPDSPLRDVAGMLRSFDYAAASTESDTAAWLAECRGAFLTGYGLAPGADAALLRALEVDKAVYEVVYESRNRPAWRHVPIDFLELLTRES